MLRAFFSIGKQLEKGSVRVVLTDKIIRASAILSALAFIPSVYLSAVSGLWLLFFADTLAFAYILFLALMPSLSYKLKVVSLLTMCYCLGVLVLATAGPLGAGYLYLSCYAIVAAFYQNKRQLIATNALCGATYALFILAIVLGLLPWKSALPTAIVVSGNALLLGALLSVATNYVIGRYEAAAEDERRLGRIKESMLREIDHRVKNNLQVISSLISLRSGASSNPAEALANVKESLSAVVLVHQLFDRRDLSYNAVVSVLFRSLFARMATLYPTVDFDFTWKGPELEVDSDAAINLSVMIDELALNSAKHAFVGRSRGRVFLNAEVQLGSRRLCLVFGDDGRGIEMPDELGKRPGGQGLAIVRAIARNFGSEPVIENSGGLRVRLELELPKAEEIDEIAQ